MGPRFPARIPHAGPAGRGLSAACRGWPSRPPPMPARATTSAPSCSLARRARVRRQLRAAGAGLVGGAQARGKATVACWSWWRSGRSGPASSMPARATASTSWPRSWSRPACRRWPTTPASTRACAAARLEQFLEADAAVMVATIAFGMGVDKPDVRYVIHADPPAAIEAYWQEIGRAGRDGAPAEGITLYSSSDLAWAMRRIDGRESTTRSRRCRCASCASSTPCSTAPAAARPRCAAISARRACRRAA